MSADGEEESRTAANAPAAAGRVLPRRAARAKGTRATRGNGQWATGPLRHLLDTVLREQHGVESFEVDQDFPLIGRRTMLLNAHLVNAPAGENDPLILVAFQQIAGNRV